jgi:dinuclear metal center YbgI/SA1388 family protein
MARLATLVSYLEDTLDVPGIPDYPNALNGLQLENAREITHVAAAVDFSSATVDGAVTAGAQLLLVHHGMFWSGVQPITAHRHQRLRTLIMNDVAVYSAHLPLDVHPELGNNALLAKRLGLEPSSGFFRYQTIDVGLSGECDIATRVIAEKAGDLAAQFRGTLVTTPFEPDRRTRRWGICTGAGADSKSLHEAARRGIDTLIVGEGPHHTAVEARELGVVVLYAGHYATETLGVRALADQLARQFDLVSTFVDVPSGL